MVLPRPKATEPLRRRFPHFSPALMEMLEACLQVCLSASGLPPATSECYLAALCVGETASHGARHRDRGIPAAHEDAMTAGLPWVPAPLQVDPSCRPTATQLLSMPYFADAPSWLSPEFRLAQVGTVATIRRGSGHVRHHAQRGARPTTCHLPLRMPNRGLAASPAGTRTRRAGAAHRSNEQAAQAAGAGRRSSGAARAPHPCPSPRHAAIPATAGAGTAARGSCSCSRGACRAGPPLPLATWHTCQTSQDDPDSGNLG